ncbi:2OG-Fe(II) oxygenase [Polaromonas jejuensis]|uniref:2OG-Fe(II) oxygenase n=1 Tax=Polaromonas jejuensis TaxID=457502 RepID=A0ABW0Q9T2_9BURK|nr:2OG-Fe(II) oxygenase [Polaromonas jejuensis]
MKQQGAVQPVTRELRAWIAAQTALGHPRAAICQALLDAGWQHAAASRALRLTPEAMSSLVVPVDTPAVPPVLAVPSVAPADSGVLVDAGDKWVEVLQRLEHPGLVVLGHLLSAGECEALVEAARPRLSRSLTVDTQTGGEERNRDRTSQGMFFTRGENAVVRRVEARIARLLNWPVQKGEGLQVLRYREGAQYKPHYDYFDPAEPGTANLLQRGGQRVATLVMYLQEPQEGGATVFPDIGLQVAPRRGHAVFFSYGCAHPCSLTLHGGDPVTVGEKWIATKWLREREFV